MTMKRFKKMPIKKKATVVLMYALMPAAWLIDSTVKAASNLLSRRKAAISCMLAAAMLLTMMTLAAVPASAEITVSQPSGSGSEGSPYQIATVENLYWFAGVVNGTLDGVTQNQYACAVLTQDIVVNENLFSKITLPRDETFKATVNSGVTLKEWKPIGGGTGVFYCGTFDGKGHTVSGLYCNSDGDNVGLFGQMFDGLVKNVGVTDSYFVGVFDVGAICGYSYSWYEASGNFKYGKIENCFSTGNYIVGAKKVGGIAGTANSVIKCYNTSTVAGYHNVGGITGSADVLVQDCYNTGSVTGHWYLQGTTSEDSYSTYSVGGIIGNLGYYTRTPIDGKAFYQYGNVNNCLNSGTVKCSRDGSGAICGTISKRGISKVTNCYYLYHCSIKNILYSSPDGEFGGNNYGEELIATQIRSGMVCYNLNNGVTDGTQVWYQTKDGSSFPTFVGETVYRGKTNCTNDFYSYANTEVGDGHLIVYNAEWDDGHFNCTKTATCSRCNEILGTETVRSMLHTIYPPTCTSQGYSYYTADFTTPGFTQEKYYFDSNARGHSPYPPTYVLSSDKTQMTASVKCATCGITLATETVAATKKAVTALTCTQDGATTYTASFTNTAYFDSTKVLTETISATGHTYVDGVCTSCGEADSTYMSANANGYYEIDSVSHLKWFAAYANMGNSGAKALLVRDLSVDNTFKHIGTASTPYSGIFDGGNHTLTVNYNVTAEKVGGLIDFAKGATVKNLNIGGTITTANHFVGGLIGYEPANSGTVTLENIRSTVNITSSFSGDNTHGGIIGVSDSPITMTNCGYSGTITAPNGTNCGGLDGWTNKAAVFNNCYMAGKMSLSATSGSATFCRGNAGNISQTNCYYLTAYGTVQGTQKSAAQFASGEVAYLLNGGFTDGTQSWYQTVGTGLPALSGKTVYGGYVNCGATDKTYANTTLAETIPSHTYSDWADNGDGTHSRTCSVCNNTEAVAHTYGAWSDNGNGTHSRVCTACGVTQTEAHVYGAWADNGNGTHSRVCTACGVTQTADHVDTDSNNICDDCGVTLVVISVTITWGAMEFTYTDASEGTWNPKTGTYENATDAGWACVDGADKITVTSESNVDLTVSFDYEQVEGAAVTGTFTDGENPVTAALPLAKKEETAQTVIVYLKLDGKPEETADKTVMGTVTVTIGG